MKKKNQPGMMHVLGLIVFAALVYFAVNSSPASGPYTSLEQACNNQINYNIPNDDCIRLGVPLNNNQ